MSESTTCTAVREAAAELALGVLVGAERAFVLSHLETCGDCRAEVQGFAAATDALFQLAPEADPPAGFEVRLLARRADSERDTTLAPVRSLEQRRAGSKRIRALLAAAAVVVLGAGVGIGTLVSPSGSARLASVRAAELSQQGSDVGSVAVAPGHPAWMFMTVQDVDWSGWIRCVVTERGGREVTVGRFWLHGGYGGWSAPLKVSSASVTGARLKLADGTTIASASLPS